MNENKEYEQLLFPSIDQNIDACLDAIQFLEKDKGTEESISCITLCRDCSELSTMLTVMIIRKSPFATEIAKVLRDICYGVHDELKKIENAPSEVFNCAKSCTASAEKIETYLKKEKKAKNKLLKPNK